MTELAARSEHRELNPALGNIGESKNDIFHSVLRRIYMAIEITFENLGQVSIVAGAARLLLVFSAAISIAWCASPISVSAAQVSEENIDRPGNDFNNFDINVPPPGSFGGPVDTCRETCQRDSNCKAWTLVKAGVQGPKARCWLKNAIPPAFTNNSCVSGVPVRSFEPNIDRPGSDYNNFDLAAADPNLCKAACENDRSTCQAWTFVKAGVQGPKPRCWLKNAIPPAFTNNSCTSGVLQEIIH